MPSAFFLGRELDGIAFRLLQNQQRDLEQRIRAARHLDLPRELFDAALFRDERDVQLRQRRGRFGPFAARFIAPVAATETAAFAVAKLGTAARRAAATFTAAAKAAAGPSRRGPRRSPGLPLKRAFGLDAFVAGELFKIVGLGFPLRPRGLEEIFQVEVEIGSVAHEKRNSECLGN